MVKEVHSSELSYSGLNYELAGQGAGRRISYWVEIFRSGVPSMPWIISNPIHIGVEDELAVEVSSGDLDDSVQPLSLSSWFIERSADAAASGSSRNGGFVMDYELGESSATYVAAAHDVSTGIIEGTIRLLVAMDKPARVSLQLRDNDGIDRRWRTSFYVDTELRRINASISEFLPVTDKLPKAVPVDQIDDLLLVVDRVNARANSSGSIGIGTLVLDDGRAN